MSGMTTNTHRAPGALLRHRDGHHARVTFEELFFDLVYVFAVTQLSHQLLHHLSWAGVLETLVLWFAVWLGWQYTCWVTNWFDPETPRIRALLFGTMLLAMLMAASIPRAFADAGLWFAGSYAAMQVGRAAYIAWQLPAGHALGPNYRRILGWMLISAVFWLAGAFVEHELRIGLWAIAVLCEYVSPMFGFALPGLGRSRTQDWTIEGGHLAERCQLFVIVALGETVLASGASLAEAGHWDATLLSALLVTFVGTLALWWLYFGTTSKDATAAITRSDDPGRIGAYLHYVHAILVLGIVATAVGHDLVMEHPHGLPTPAQAIALAAGPALYLLGSAIYKKIVYGRFPASHIVGALAVCALAPLALQWSMLLTGTWVVLIVLGVSLWETLRCRLNTPPPHAA